MDVCYMCGKSLSDDGKTVRLGGIRNTSFTMEFMGV